MPYLDVQISLDGMDAATNDAVRGDGSWAAARRAMDNLAAADFGEFKISIVCTRHNVDQLDAYKAMADDYGAQLRITRLRPSGRGVDSYRDLRMTNDQQRQVFHWILDHPDVLTGDSFFHLNALGASTGGEPARPEHVRRRPDRVPHRPGRRRLRLPVRDPRRVPRRQRPRRGAASPRCGGNPSCSTELRQPQSAGACASCGSFDACQGGCMATKFFTGLALDGPDPDCVHGHADDALAAAGSVPRPSQDHSRPGATVPVALTRKPH